MAKPIPLELPPRDKRQELVSRLQNAPVEHAEAILAGYEVLQGLYDAGVLELLRGLLGIGDQVLGIAVDSTRAPESVRIIRNLILLRKILSEIDPEQFEGFVQALPEALHSAKEQEQESPGLLSTMNQFRDKDVLYGMHVVNSLLKLLGREFVSSANAPSKK